MSIREELELDVSPALKAIDQIDSALGTVTQGFKASLADALSVLTSVTLDVDASAVAPEIESAISGADTAIPIEADVSAAEAEIVDLTSLPPPPVQIDADTTAAQESIAELGTAASGSSEGLTQISGATDSFSIAAGVAAGDASGLQDALGSLGPEAEVAAAGLAAVAATTAVLFSKAVASEGVMQSFNATLGTLGDEVRTIKIGDLTTDLGKLAESLGSDDEAAFGAAQRLAVLGKSAGETDANIVSTTQNVILLAANARATNPALGELGDLTNSLSAGLARGGRPLRQFGIDLTAAEINARALTDTGKTTVDQLSQFEKTAAGAALATEQLGGAIQTNIEGAGDNAQINLGRIQQEFENTLETLGTPLISPVFDLLEAAAPIAEKVAAVFGKLDAIVVPIATGVIQAVSPIVDILGTQLIDTLDELEPAFSQLAGSIGEATSSLAPLLDEMATGIQLGTPLAKVTTELASGFTSLGAAGGAFAGLFQLSLGPLGNVLGLLGQIKDLLPGDDGDKKKAEDLQQAIFGESVALDKTESSLKRFSDTFGDFAQSDSTFAKDKGTLEKLNDLGESSSDLLTQLQGGEQGFKDFTAAAIDAGQIKLKIDGVEQTGEDVKGLVFGLQEYRDEGRLSITQGKDLSKAFEEQAGAISEASQSQFNLVTSSLGLNETLRQEIVDRATGKDGITNYTQALQILGEVQRQQAVDQVANVLLPQQQQIAGWQSLAQAVLAGDVTSQNFTTTTQNLAAGLGVTSDQIGTFVATIEAKIAEVAASITANIPQATAAFDGLTAASSPAELAKNLELQTLVVANFTTNLKTLLANGNTDLVALLAQQGPQIGGAYADALVKGKPATAAALEGTIDTFRSKSDELSAFLTNEAAPKIVGEDITGLARDGTTALGLNLDFKGAAVQPIAELGNFISNNPGLAAVATQAGKTTGANMGGGIATGLTDSSPEIQDAARQVIRDAEDAARDEADSHSPSRLFASLGADLAGGIAVGIDDGSTQVVKAAEQIVQDAFGAIQGKADIGIGVGGQIATDSTANLVAAGVQAPTAQAGSISIGQILVQLTPPAGSTPEQVQAMSAAATTGALDAAKRAATRVDTRAS